MDKLLKKLGDLAREELDRQEKAVERLLTKAENTPRNKDGSITFKLIKHEDS